ncbi:MAG: hypothetical protein H7259_02345 [Cytophagales bacterium]|nr:hypothetical protein [Cytophaga sp.]
MKQFFLILFVTMLLSSCHKSDDAVPAINGTEYYPVAVGNFWIYNVHDTYYNNGQFDTTFQVKEVIHDTFIFEGTVIYELYRFYRHSDTIDWPFQPDSVWTLSEDPYQLTITEASTEYIRLSFPFYNNKQWDGNRKNVSGADDYILKNIGKPYTYDTFSYSSTCNVEEAHSKDLVSKDYRNRIYAENIGLVYKKYESIQYKTDPSFIGLDIIDFGKITEQKLIDYGKQ